MSDLNTYKLELLERTEAKYKKIMKPIFKDLILHFKSNKYKINIADNSITSIFDDKLILLKDGAYYMNKFRISMYIDQNTFINKNQDLMDLVNNFLYTKYIKHFNFGIFKCIGSQSTEPNSAGISLCVLVFQHDIQCNIILNFDKIKLNLLIDEQT